MLTEEEFVDVNALHRRGWTISAIARHLGRDRKTIRAYVEGRRQPGVRRRAVPDVFEPFEVYVRERLLEDPHLWGTALYEEVLRLGYSRSYVTFVREIRRRGLRPRCEACAGVKGRPTIEIEHPPGEEMQWDWLELPEAPWGGQAQLLVGTLSYSGRFRAVFAESEEQPQLIAALDGVQRRLGGTTRRWRFDRMATVCEPGSGRLLASFAAVARYYGVQVDVCERYRANRKGAVESRNNYIAQRFWRTLRAARSRRRSSFSTVSASNPQTGVAVAPRRSPGSPPPSGCHRCRRCRTRRCLSSSGSSRRAAWSATRATVTRCRPGCTASA
jgi:transposase